MKSMSDYTYCTADPAWYELLKTNAREHRKHPTEAESALWSQLKGNALGQPFRQQHIIGDYIVDFLCLPSRLVVELDGGYHRKPEQMAYDQSRTEWLKTKGFNVIRFTNEEVLTDMECVINTIKQNIK